MRKTTPIPHPKSRPSLSHKILLSAVEPLTENKSDGSAFPWTQHHEGVRQPLHERGVLEAVVAVVGVAVNWLGAHVRNVLRGDGREGHNMHLSIWNTRKRCGLDCFKRGNELGVVVGRVVLDSGMVFDGLQTEHLSETVRDFHRLVALGVTRTTARLNGRGDLNPIQAISAANGRRGRVVEEFAGGADLISGRDYGNAEGYRIHAGCLGFL